MRLREDMAHTIQTVTLVSERKFGRSVPSKALGEILRVLPEVVRASIRMAFESRSRARGPQPAWLKQAADIRFLDHSGDEATELHFQVPTLGEAAETLYRQQEIWPSRPDARDTGFDLLADVVRDIANHHADSERFDPHLLRQFQKFSRGLNGTFQRIQFTGQRTPKGPLAEISASTVTSATKLCHETPAPQQVRLVGKLDMIRSSTNGFAVQLKSGEEARGVLTEGKIGPCRDLLEHDVLVLGKAVFRASGKLLRIDAQSIAPANGQADLFSAMPKPSHSRFSLPAVVQGQRQKQGIHAVMGKWPGDESDEEVEAALREIG